MAILVLALMVERSNGGVMQSKCVPYECTK
jgi:hypothetical protein